MLEAAQARVAELEAELAMRPGDQWKQLKEAVVAARAAKADAEKQARAEVAEEMAALKAENARLKSDPQGAAAEQIAALNKQLKGARTQIKNLKVTIEHLIDPQTSLLGGPRSKPLGTLSKAEMNTPGRGLHPDAKYNEAALNKAAALLNILIDEGRLVVGELQ